VVSGAVVSFCAISLTVGYLVPRLMRLGPPQSIAISLEIGLHNTVVALGVALSSQLLNSVEMATPVAIYGALSPLMALTFIFAVRLLDPALRVKTLPDTVASESGV
jgi:BASS family bile acid:Na+ symporter